MDEETQYRCAGFLQSEIEQFVDDLEAGGDKVTTTEDESSHPESASEVEQEAEGKRSKKGKKGRPKRVVREDTPGTSSVLRRDMSVTAY
jgi:cohesin complex subunit SA-1/2